MSNQVKRTLPSDQDASGRSFGDEELAYLKEALDSGTLTPTRGKQVPALEAAFAEMIGVKHAIACTSGSAAVQVAVAVVNPQPGDEIITTSITDMGALTAILYQGGVPMFVDVDPQTLNVTAETIRPKISPRTKAIIVTHLFGNPCDMDGINALAAEHNLPVIEDAAQSFGAQYQGRPTGSLGTIGCFSLQQGKHITTGEGGLVTTDDDDLAKRARHFVNKAWPYGEPNPDHGFIAPNMRMTELIGAVARAQIEKLPRLIEKRLHASCILGGRLMNVPGITPPVIRKGDTHSHWRYPIMVDADVIEGGVDALASELRDIGIPAAPRYIVKPAFKCKVIKDQVTFGDSHWPFSEARPEACTYADEDFTGTYKALSEVLVLPLNEAFTEDDMNWIADCIIGAVERLTQGAIA